MKKIVLVIGLIVAAAASQAQGLFTFSETAFKVSTNGATSGIMTTSANSYYFTLLYSTVPIQNATLTGTNVLDSSFWTWSGVYGTNQTITPLAGGINSPATDQSGTWMSTTNYYVVIGWSASLGSDWGTVSNELFTANNNGGNWSTAGYFGISSIGYGVANPSPAPAFQAFGSAAGQIQAFTLYAVPVPEPTTIALAGLGGVALLAFRRRKA